MENKIDDKKQAIVRSYKWHRSFIGYLGVILPLLMIYYSIFNAIFNFELCYFEDSISAYYHTPMRNLFVGILCCIGVFLVSYHGYDKETKEKGLSDNATTNLAGFCAILIALFPTSKESACFFDMKFCNIVHLLSALLFFGLLGYMSYYLFTSSDKEKLSKRKTIKNKIFRRCGFVIWFSLAVIIFLNKIEPSNFRLVLIFESIAIWAFGYSWLVKGGSVDIKEGVGEE